VSELILLEREREEKKPHIQGPAICLACKHEWQAVVPAGADVSKMQCPECATMRGTFATHIETAGSHWNCSCGNHLFAITAEGVYCPCCSQWQFGAKLTPAR
jgi:hypothetical protein